MKHISDLADETFRPEDPLPDPMPQKALPVGEMTPAPKKHKGDQAFFDYMEESQSSTQSTNPTPPPRKESTRVRVQKELRTYSKTSQLGVRDNPLEWWAEQEGTFPVLASVAKRALAIPASSAQDRHGFGVWGIKHTKIF